MTQTNLPPETVQYFRESLQNGKDFEIELLDESQRKVVFYNAQTFLGIIQKKAHNILNFFKHRGQMEVKLSLVQIGIKKIIQIRT